MMKLDVDTLSTVPDAPPEAGPDRAFAPPAEPLPAVAGGDVVVAEDVPQAAETPITAHISPAARIHRLLLIDSNRRTPGPRSCLAAETVSRSLAGSESFMNTFLLFRQSPLQWPPVT